MSTGTMAMAARPRKGREKTPARPPDDRIGVIHLKGTVQYAQWLEDLHRRTHIPKAVLIRLALAEWAEHHGHPAPPEF